MDVIVICFLITNLLTVVALPAPMVGPRHFLTKRPLSCIIGESLLAKALVMMIFGPLLMWPIVAILGPLCYPTVKVVPFQCIVIFLAEWSCAACSSRAY